MSSSSNSKSNSLMGDLESIKALLEEEDLEAVPESLSQALHPAIEVDAQEQIEEEIEEPLEEQIDDAAFDLASDLSEPLSEPLADSLKEIQLSNTSLDALLGEEFHEATAEVMERARGLINQHANQWSPQQTDELADALRVRIDGAVEQWIQTSLSAHAAELQQRLLNAVRTELARHLEAFERT